MSCFYHQEAVTFSFLLQSTSLRGFEKSTILLKCLGIIIANIGLLSTLEQKNCNLPKVKINEMLAFVRHVRAEVPADNDMPNSIDKGEI